MYPVMLANPFAQMLEPVIGLLNQALVPVLGLVLALGTIYCVFLGLKLAKAEEPQEREKAKGAIKNAILGFLLIFVLILALKVGMNAMAGWLNDTVSTSISVSGAVSAASVG